MDLVLEDGTGSGEIVLAVSQELMEMAGEEEAPENLFIPGNLPEGTTVEPYEEDGYVGQRAVFDEVELSEFSEFSDAEVAITYDEEAALYEVDGLLDFGTEDDLADLPPGLIDSFDVSISVTFPGEVLEHNGELDGRTVTWTPSAGTVAEIRAVAEEGDGSSGSTWLRVTLAVVAALLVIGVVLFLIRRQGQAGASAGDGAAGAAPGDATRDPSQDVPGGGSSDLSGGPEPGDDRR